MARILAVGVATLDIVNEVDSYPGEDDEVRALAQTVRRGGNATNTLVVLSQLGHACEWAGVLVDHPLATVIDEDLARHRIGSRYCRRVSRGTLPTSCITLSRDTACRSIVHYRDMPEFDSEAFSSIPHTAFDWIHFEGRNVPETHGMMRHVRDNNPQCTVSLELEKPRQDIDTLLPFADLVLTTTLVAQERGCSPEVLLRKLRERAPHAVIACTLGNQGAIALDLDGALASSPAFPPVQLVDTVGAGDAFNAAMIHGRLRGERLQESLEFACRLAGIKCGQNGLSSLSAEHVSLTHE